MQSSRQRRIAPRALAILAAACSALFACSGAHRTEAFYQALANARSATDSALQASNDARVSRSAREARAQVHAALARCAPDSDTFRTRALITFVDAGDLASASLLSWFWAPSLSDTDAFERYLMVLRSTGRVAEAQALAWRAAQDDPRERPRWIRAWYASLAADPTRIAPPLEDLSSGPLLDELTPFRGHSSIILKARLNRDAVAAFKPHQDLRHQSYRGEVAAYRLCALIHCTFVIPESREAWLQEATFRTLSGSGPRDALRFGTHRDLIFFDHEHERRLYGVWKAWVPELTHFPIEYTEVWAPLTSAGVSADALRQLPLAQALHGLQGQRRGFYDQIVRMTPGFSAYELAQQLSELHVFDMLINNFDRYQPEWFGMNAHWSPQGLLSIDNGASFSLETEFRSSTTRRRAERIQVFSRTMIDALRWMDDEAAFALMFPPSPWCEDEEERFDAFVERRALLLEHIDALVDQYGPDAVYLFP